MCLLSFPTNSQLLHFLCSLYIPQFHPKFHALACAVPVIPVWPQTLQPLDLASQLTVKPSGLLPISQDTASALMSILPSTFR